MAAPPVFLGANYHIWPVKMKSYLEACELWDMVENDQIQPLPEDSILEAIRNQRNEVNKRSKAKTCIHSAIFDEVFTSIMACETAKKAWDMLKEVFQGNDRT